MAKQGQQNCGMPASRCRLSSAHPRQCLQDVPGGCQQTMAQRRAHVPGGRQGPAIPAQSAPLHYLNLPRLATPR